MKQNISTNQQKYTSVNILKRMMIVFFKRRIFQIIAKQSQKKSLCDAGCGEGFIVNYLAENFKDIDLYGFDKSEKAIGIAAKRNLNVKYTVDDVYACKYPDNSFDIVTLLEVLEHLEYPQKALKEILRISKKTLIISVPQEPFFSLGNFFTGKNIRSLGNPPEHINRWTYFEFKKYLHEVFPTEKFDIKMFNLFVWTIAVIEKNKKHNTEKYFKN